MSPVIKESRVTSDDHFRLEDLAPEDFTRLNQNWTAVNAELDELIGLVQAHRASGCRYWFCFDEQTATRITTFEIHEMAMLLQAAVERLIAAPKEDHVWATRPDAPTGG